MRLIFIWIFLGIVAAVSRYMLAPMAQAWAESQVVNYTGTGTPPISSPILTEILFPTFAWVVPIICLGAALGATVNAAGGQSRSRR